MMKNNYKLTSKDQLQKIDGLVNIMDQLNVIWLQLILKEKI